MQTAASTRQHNLDCQIELCVKIAGLGFGPDVMRLALARNGVAPAAARLIALSVTRSRAALKAIEAGATRCASTRANARGDPDRDRASRAAEYFLRRMAAFIWFGLIAIGGGLALGWTAGFEAGVADGYDWVERSVERMLWR